MTKPLDETATITGELRCKACGWPVVDAVCNDDFLDFAPGESWDWWYYCANKSCVNHRGEGVFQRPPTWIVSVPLTPESHDQKVRALEERIARMSKAANTFYDAVTDILDQGDINRIDRLCKKELDELGAG